MRWRPIGPCSVNIWHLGHWRKCTTATSTSESITDQTPPRSPYVIWPSGSHQCSHVVKQLHDTIGHNYTLQLASLDEPVVDHMVQECQEVVVEAVNVEYPAGFAVNTQLRPGHDLHELLVGAEP